jgi:serine/threonine protein kinase
MWRLYYRLRWGGQVIFVGREKSQTTRLAAQFANSGFEITQSPRHVTQGPLGMPIPFFSRKIHYFVARKVQLVRPGETTDRFTYHVHLDHPHKNGTYVVVKEVPSLELVMARLRSKWRDLPDEVIEKRARKFSDKIFPTFLTREAAILKIVHRDLPEAYRLRMPRVLTMEQDNRGMVRRLHLNWLRNGGEPLSQLEFARQSADLLRILHDEVGVMHLDLRLDNFVITPSGVGFVDFGSAVRVDENLKENPLLSSLFEELMRTSEIQRMLFSMTRTGQVTSQAISCGLHKVDKAVDYFYLAVQINSPHSNPDLKGLIQYNKDSDEALALSQLTEQILRPKDPARPGFRSAADILRGIEQIEESLGRRRQKIA